MGIATLDNFQNFTAALGLGANNQLSNSSYGFNQITRDRGLLEAAYRGSWVVGIVVDAPAEDMTRAGIEIESTISPEDNDVLQAALFDMQIWQALQSCLKWARLYGGSLGYLMIDGQDPSTPLDMDSISPGQFKGIMPLDRWMVQPGVMRPIREFGPNFGLPSEYTMMQTVPLIDYWPVIHHTRMLRFTGIELPFNQRMAENMWGESVVERIYDRLISFDSTTIGAAQLVYKAHLRIMKVDQLRNIIAAGGPAMAGLTAQIANMRLTQANEGITLLDTTDEFEAQAYTFAGLSDMLMQFGQQIAGAGQIPLVRLFGQSPAGLGSTGEADLRTYYDGLAKNQERDLRQPLVKVLDIISRSVLKKPLPKGTKFRFNPLWLIKETERSSLGAQTTDSVIKAFEAGLISQAVALKELRQSSHVTGIWSNITDEDIKDADDLPPKAETEVDTP
jgi:phage-related protein (TIGR01555 family)